MDTKLLSSLLMATAASALGQSTQNVILVNDTSTDVHTGGDDTRRVVWVDYDADGDLDLFALNFASPNRVFANQGGGSLVEDVGGGNDLLGTSDALGVAFGDLDGDGDDDAVIANGSHLANTVLENLSAAPDNQPGVFAQIASAGLGGELKQSFGVALGDLDGDGVLDLVVANRYDSNDVYLGDGDGTFTRTTSTPIDDFAFGSRDIEIADIDDDGDLDVLIANSSYEDNLYFVNQGGDQGGTEGTFGTRSLDSPGGTPSTSFGLSVGDLDNDGLLDAVVANRNEDNSLHRNTYTGAGLPTFSRVSGTAVDGVGDDSYDVAIGDLEGDGDPDLVFANRVQNNAVYLASRSDPLNDVAEGFQRVLDGELAGDRGNSRSIALADLNDYTDPLSGQPIAGALEVAVANTGGGANWLYRSYGPQWADIGAGLGGTGGVPALSGLGHTAPGETVTLQLAGAPTGASTALALSVAVTALPFKGGTLFPDPTPGLGVVLLTGATDGAGEQELPLSISASLPPGVPAGFAVYAQMLVADATAIEGIGISNGLRLRISN